MSTPFIGAVISLVSKAEVRYEGTLYNIDPVKATVALQNGGEQKITNIWQCPVCLSTFFSFFRVSRSRSAVVWN